jgi:uncharacterized RDD family membrane protein YckC
MADTGRSDTGRSDTGRRHAGPSDGGAPMGAGFDPKPHAYDPWRQPEYFEGVTERRVIAFLIDLVVIMVPVALATIFIFLLGIFTLGLGFLLFTLLHPATVIWVLAYYGITMGGRWSATVGMRAVDLQVRTWYGAPCYVLLGAVHGLAFWVTVMTLSPLVVVVGLLNGRRRLLHDFVLGTVIVNNERRAAFLRGPR